MKDTLGRRMLSLSRRRVLGRCRWERGSSGLNAAFASNAYTRSLYRGIVEVTPIRATDCLLTGKGVDAALLVSVMEGAWTEDVQKLEKEMFHNGV